MAIEDLAGTQPTGPWAQDVKTLQERIRRVLLQMRQAIQALQALPTVTAGALTGEIKLWSGKALPTGYLWCDGASVAVTAYPALFAAIGSNYGRVDAGHFNVPDLRGKFPRGTDNMGSAAGAANNDPSASGRSAQATGGNAGNQVGSVQADAFQGHSFNIVANGQPVNAGATSGSGQNSYVDGGFATGGHPEVLSGPVNDGSNGVPRTDKESRPINVYVNFIIKT